MGEYGMSGKFGWIDVYSEHRSVMDCSYFCHIFSLSSECWFLF